MRSAGVALQVTEVTGGVLQAKAGLVSLCHLEARADLQQIVMAELVHAVVMSVKIRISKHVRVNRQEGSWVQIRCISIALGLSGSCYSMDLLGYLEALHWCRVSIFLSHIFITSSSQCNKWL